MKRETQVQVQSGWVFLILDIILYLVAVGLILWFVLRVDAAGMDWLSWTLLGSYLLLLIAAILISVGFFILQPNESAVLLLFGQYIGTSRHEGFNWTNPFYTKKKISLRLRNLNVEKLKVNDKTGNPIEIAAVVVWRVEDSYAAFFEVDVYTDYVRIQSESALRHLATSYPYDSWEDETVISLRGDVDQVSKALEQELQERLIKAGVQVLESRLSHLAYAPEIAEAMLRRQQASAVIAARSKIVEGAVSMVRMALEHLSRENIVELDDERKAAMVSNLLVVLCSETNAQPVINTGTLYS